MNSNEEKGVVDMNSAAGTTLNDTQTTTNTDTTDQPAALRMVNLHNHKDKTTRSEKCDGLTNPAYIKGDDTENGECSE